MLILKTFKLERNTIMKYQNTINTKIKKMKDRYLNDLFQSNLDENYRWQLRSLIGKAVRIESLNYEITTKTLESETGEYEVKEIMLKDACVTRVKPYDNESLPIHIDHIWIMVGNDLELDKDYTKIRVDGTISEYIKTSGVKDIGVDAETLEFNNGTNIVVPKNYMKTSANDEIEKVEEQLPEVVCPYEFSHMVLNAKECEFLGLWKMYGFEANGKDAPPFSIVKNFGGPYKFTNMYNKITAMKFTDAMYKYLLNNDGRVFNVNDLTFEERARILGKIESCVNSSYKVTKTHAHNDTTEIVGEYFSKSEADKKRDAAKEKDRGYYGTYIYSVKFCYWTYMELIDEIIRNINVNTTNKTIDYKKLQLLAESGFVTIGEGHIGTYEQELAEYNKLMQHREEQLKKLREEYGSLEIQIKEIEKPVNKDYTYYYAIPTEKAINLIRWFGNEVPEHVALTSVKSE